MGKGNTGMWPGAAQWIADIPCSCLTDPPASPQAPNSLCRLLLLGMKSFTMRGRGWMTFVENRIRVFKAPSLLIYKFSASVSIKKPQTSIPQKNNLGIAAQFSINF